MSQITDMRAAIIAILKADTDVSTEVGTRVFGDELPRNEVDNQPRKAIVVAPSGGNVPTFAQGSLRLEVQRLDIFCYAKTLLDAEEVRRAVFGAMRAIQRTVASNVLVHWARPAGGAAQGRDQTGDWAFKFNSWQVMAAEQAAS